MNLAVKTRWANIITAIVSALVLFQGYLTTPPFTPDNIATIGSIVAFLVLILTSLKQWLSPEVSDTAAKVTLWAVGIAFLSGILDLLDVFKLDAELDQRIRFWVSAAVMVINILSKTLFPSKEQQAKMEVLKHE